MLNWVGRIILLAVGGCLVAFSIYPLINDIQALNAIGWNVTTSEGQFLLIGFIINAVTILAAAPAIIAGLTGKGGFWLFLVSALLLAGMIYLVIVGAQAGALNSWEAILEIIKGFALPLAYIAGNILVMFAKPPRQAR